jgi:catechol 2,3-dioxygenase-like lactoylglutathione lyase family enzyme
LEIESLDHLVLTVRSIEATVRFYEDVLGMQHTTFGEGRHALWFGSQKINLHEAGNEFKPNAAVATPGSADLCFISSTPLAEIQEELTRKGVAIEQGPVQRTGATGPILSLYIRDPDGNLIELSNVIKE